MKPIKLLLTMTLVIPHIVLAADMGQGGDGRDGREGQPPGPPPAFLEACKGKKDGDTLTMQNPQGQRVAGSCRLVWMPNARPQGQGGQPPRQGMNNPPPPNR